jgi:hydroxymethylbilane synthase
VKEIEDALLRDEIDLAVHSSKDMPAVLPEGLTIGAVLPREDPLDAIVLPETVRVNPAIDAVLTALGPTPVLGTSSVRRVAQLMRIVPGARFAPIRGNLDTRLRKLDRGEYGALILAAAGLRRLGMASRISATLPAASCVPAPGQGIVAIEIREGDGVGSLVQAIDDRRAHAALDAERAVVEALGGGCQTPIGVFASTSGDELDLMAVVVSLDGRRAIRGADRGRMGDAAAIGARVGARLLADGAGAILAEADRSQGAVEGIQP